MRISDVPPGVRQSTWIERPVVFFQYGEGFAEFLADRLVVGC
jgi:hypothetical protein